VTQRSPHLTSPSLSFLMMSLAVVMTNFPRADDVEDARR
jgi:hypothetical protein